MKNRSFGSFLFQYLTISLFLEHSKGISLKLTRIETIHFSKKSMIIFIIKYTVGYKLKKLSDAINLIFDVTASGFTKHPSMYRGKYLQ